MLVFAQDQHLYCQLFDHTVGAAGNCRRVLRIADKTIWRRAESVRHQDSERHRTRLFPTHRMSTVILPPRQAVNTRLVYQGVGTSSRENEPPSVTLLDTSGDFLTTSDRPAAISFSV
jgi:hypothetical protein